jgi:hypothetical protein
MPKGEVDSVTPTSTARSVSWRDKELHRGRLIDHIGLVVRDLAASKSFYCAVFGVLKIPVGGSDERNFWAAAGGRPLLRGLCVAQDPKADRLVTVHGATRVEFLLVHSANTEPLYAETNAGSGRLAPRSRRRRFQVPA